MGSSGCPASVSSAPSSALGPSRCPDQPPCAAERAPLAKRGRPDACRESDCLAGIRTPAKETLFAWLVKNKGNPKKAKSITRGIIFAEDWTRTPSPLGRRTNLSLILQCLLLGLSLSWASLPKGGESPDGQIHKLVDSHKPYPGIGVLLGKRPWQILKQLGQPGQSIFYQSNQMTPMLSGILTLYT